MQSAFDIIAEPNRRAILSLLVLSQQSVGQIERQLRMPQPTVSKHLRALRGRFVESTVDAQQRLYRWIHTIPILGYIHSPFEEIQTTPRYPVYLRAGTCPFGILDVERPCPLTTYFEEIGLNKTLPRTAAGGNPRYKDAMNPSERIDKLIAGLTDWRGNTLSSIRKSILESDPEIIEEWKWMGSPVWSHDGMIAVANAHKDKVKLTFSHGASLPDPDKLFNAGLGGKLWRAIDLFEGDKINERALRNLVRAAVDYNQIKLKRKAPAGTQSKVNKRK